MAKAKRKNRNWLIYALLGLIALLIGIVVIRNQNKPKGEKVVVEKVEARTIKEIVAASGKVFPKTEIKISSDVSGEIVELFVEDGDSVVAGQVLAKIDPDAYESQVERARASVNRAKADLANAKSGVTSSIAQREQIEAQLIAARTIHERNIKLRKDGVVSQADFDNSLSNLQALEANLRASKAAVQSSREMVSGNEFSIKSAEASLKELRTSLSRTTIVAPRSGIISRLDVEQGERVVGTIQMQGTEMMRIADLNDMEVRVDVSESDIPRVSIGDEVEIEVDAYLGRAFTGKVTLIANSATSTGSAVQSLTSDQVTNFEVRIDIDPKSYLDLITDVKKHPMRPGMSASVEINTQTKGDVLTVPIQAVTTREKDDAKKKKINKKEGDEEEELSENDLKEVVFLYTVADTAKMVEVRTGIQDDSFIEILSGLEDGAEVITAPYSAISRKLKNGEKIRKVKEEELYKEN